MSCIFEYFSYYYHTYCIPKKNYIKDKINKINYSSTKLEIDNTYNLLFTIYDNSSSKLNIVLYEIFNNGININNRNRSNVFLYDNKIYKISKIHNIKKYLNIIHTIRNYKIKNIIIPEEIYYNKLQNESVQIFKYYSNGDLFDYFINTKLDYTEILYLYKLIINIVSNLHINYIAHRDLKLENFLIYNLNNELNIILIDLDFCVFLNTKDNFTGGTQQYASYEITNNITINNWFSTDIWSLCIILYIFLFKEFPWHNSNNSEETFINYINNYNNTFWYNKLKNLNLEENHRVVYSKIFNYGFNLNVEERNDIIYIQDLLNTI